MILTYIHADNTKENISIKTTTKVKKSWINIDALSKIEFIKQFLPAFYSGQKIILFDKNHKQLLKFHQDTDINTLQDIDKVNKEAQLLFFTSGSSGFPVGAFKSRKNLLEEVSVLKNLLKDYNIKRVVVSVPFVHIYGIIAGLLLPSSLGDIELIIKDDFLPYDLFDQASKDDTLIVTTPVFIKALARLDESKRLSSCLFISSTGPLHSDDVVELESKYSTKVLQLFGSTETSGIAYKIGKTKLWKNLEHVEISSIDSKLSVKSPFVSKYILNKKITKLNIPFTTEDIIEINNNKFELIGRSNKLIKIAGKRISALEIESMLESIDDVNKAIVEIVYKKDLLRSEQIKITLESNQDISKSIIKSIIAQRYGTLTIPFSLTYVDKINYSSVGKKVIFS
ncbi:class I adenylate-forming enzyme family protein [Sulfurimonas sp.]|uniref:class I adenylate-forming enzyme family protein n=1 Tax=Sulfurimonas sp. TaxID=2022749 RepID=UPI002AB26A81|nr:class I adenylate-forming enzyme family protein [Sulfurimonas sp.]